MIERSQIWFEAGGRRLAGTIALPKNKSERPFVMFIHGWEGTNENYVEYERSLVRSGYGTFSVDLSGQGSSELQRSGFNRKDHIDDVLGAYDALFTHPSVDVSSIFVVGESYGGYLAAMLAAERPLAGAVLRAPALYPDQGSIDPSVLGRGIPYPVYRESVAPDWHNRALESLTKSQVAVLVVSSEHDEFVPTNAIMTYLSAARGPKEHYLLTGAKHNLDQPSIRRFDSILHRWLRSRLDEPVFG